MLWEGRLAEYNERTAAPEGLEIPEGAARPTRGGSPGGKAVVEKYGKDHMAAIGRKGSRAVVKKYGLRFYSEIAARNKGVKKNRNTTVEAE